MSNVDGLGHAVRRARRSVALAASRQGERPGLLRKPGADSHHPLRAAHLLCGPDGDKVFVLIHIQADAKSKHYDMPNEGHLRKFAVVE